MQFVLLHTHITHKSLKMMDRRTELMQLTVDELVDLIIEMENERPICDLE